MKCLPISSAIGEGSFRTMILNIASRSNNATEQQMVRQLITSLSNMIPEDIGQAAEARMKANVDWFTSLEGLVTVEFYERYGDNAV